MGTGGRSSSSSPASGAGTRRLPHRQGRHPSWRHPLARGSAVPRGSGQLPGSLHRPRRQRRRAHQFRYRQSRVLSGDRGRHQPDLRADACRASARATASRSKRSSTGPSRSCCPSNARSPTARAATDAGGAGPLSGQTTQSQRADAGLDSRRGELRLFMRHITSTLGLITVCGLLGGVIPPPRSRFPVSPSR